jgi:hypothetical protein
LLSSVTQDSGAEAAATGDATMRTVFLLLSLRLRTLAGRSVIRVDSVTAVPAKSTDPSGRDPRWYSAPASRLVVMTTGTPRSIAKLFSWDRSASTSFGPEVAGAADGDVETDGDDEVTGASVAGAAAGVVVPQAVRAVRQAAAIIDRDVRCIVISSELPRTSQSSPRSTKLYSSANWGSPTSATSDRLASASHNSQP